MNHFSPTVWRAVLSLALLAVAAAVIAWLALRKRPSADELEKTRRKLLAQSGRMVDGMLLDLYEMDGPDRQVLSMLVFSYRIGGVDYECSQDITALREAILPSKIRAGFPCSVRYQPGNPHNSIVVAEGWTGLREGLPAPLVTGDSAHAGVRPANPQ
ncbi:MAG TPA: hypothetical protein VFU68_04315 [Terracidiphilus sp.]|nr:hypothetical protein [Terracidiphilus sp.]